MVELSISFCLMSALYGILGFSGWEMEAFENLDSEKIISGTCSRKRLYIST